MRAWKARLPIIQALIEAIEFEGDYGFGGIKNMNWVYWVLAPNKYLHRLLNFKRCMKFS
jgi:hypothetical protein